MQIICLMIFLLVVYVLAQSDSESLLELRKGFKKDPSGKILLSWDSKSLESNGCPHNWYGITCNSNGHVTSIILNDMGLLGDFDFSAISGITTLRNLSLSNNRLTGFILKIGLLNSLELLDLSSNMFHGMVPSTLINLNNLVLCNLSMNQFEGSLPSNFGKIVKLKYIDLRANKFSGDVMHLLSQMGSVIYADLSSNSFTGSLDLGLGNSSFISSIQYLNISHNMLAGELFAHDGMPYFDSLEVFDATSNQFVGTIPSFNFVVSLRILRIGSNQLSGSLPEALLKESSMLLSELDLSLNQLEGPVGSITSTTLKKLNISSNKLSGSLPANIGHCAAIDLSNNMLYGQISRIQSWGNYVEVIQLSSNSLTGPLPDQTSQFLRLTSFKVSNNLLEGILPSVLGTYPELKVIDLSFNKLSGSLLVSLFNSTKLTDLNLSGNNFSGPLPLLLSDETSDNLVQNLSLMSLDLSQNSLTGHLPPELSEFHNLVYLNLSHNNFEGVLPDDLPEGLKGFDVSSNNLSGVIPEILWQFPDSSFHPGNSLLIFPRTPSSPGDNSGLTLRVHGSHMKPAIRIVLIAGLVGAACMAVLLCIMVYYRARKNEAEKTSSLEVGHGGKKLGDLEEGGYEPNIKNTSLPLSSSTNFHQDIIQPLSPTGSDTKKPQGVNNAEQLRKEKGMSTPMSFISSSNPSPSNKTQTLEACSLDKLPGDLHLFNSCSVFTGEELSRAPAEIIGRSCHGTLYKATLDSGHILAIKWLREGMAKGRKEFAREIKKLGNIKHPNLVSVSGYYWGTRDHEKLVISNFINAPSLAFYLQETDQRKLPPLTLHDRLKIAIDVARCLSYLHNDKSIPHGNLKSTNILLENPSMNARLTDYSLHRILTPAGTAEQVLNAAALGYMPPEFASSTSKPCPSMKSDVYAFGVVLFELLTGKGSGEIVCGVQGVVDLTDWVRFLAGENRSVECIDTVIVDSNSKEREVVDGMFEAGLRCTLPASERPDMRMVYEDLSMMMK